MLERLPEPTYPGSRIPFWQRGQDIWIIGNLGYFK
jgi:hypothetical protein